MLSMSDGRKNARKGVLVKGPKPCSGRPFNAMADESHKAVDAIIAESSREKFRKNKFLNMCRELLKSALDV